MSFTLPGNFVEKRNGVVAGEESHRKFLRNIPTSPGTPTQPSSAGMSCITLRQDQTSSLTLVKSTDLIQFSQL